MNGRQRFISALLTVLSVIMLLCGCSGEKAASADTAPALPAVPETGLFAVQVGKGDALILRDGEKTYLIDAGKVIRWGRVHSALTMLGVKRLDAVFLTHTDKDHAGGLMPLALSELEIGAWYASAYYAEPKKEKNHPAVQAAAVRGQSVRFLKAGDTAEGIFTVLAPKKPDESDEDNNSLVLRTEVNGVRFLLTGDMEQKEEKALLKSGADISCDVLKVPNHGDKDACSAELWQRTGAKIAVISTDPDEKPGTPDELLLEEMEEAGFTVCRTDLSKGMIAAACEAGQVKISEYALPHPADVSGITVEIGSASSERITVENKGKTAADLTGCYFISLRKEEAYLFPAGTVLLPGEKITVGTFSTPYETDLVWPQKKVFSGKKEDGVTFFDAGAAPIKTCRINED